MKYNAKILIVEDEALTAKQIDSQIRKMGYKNINIAINYHKAMRSIKDEIPDLILLDINLESNHNGIDLASEKEVFNRIPIIYITGGYNSRIRKEAIATNPKTFLSKPINVVELEANMSLALGHKKGLIDIGYELSYDFDNRLLFYKNSSIVKLSKNEKTLLEILIETKGEAVHKKLLESEVWGDRLISENSLRTLVGNLRKKLGDKDMIVNISSIGYRLPLPKDEI